MKEFTEAEVAYTAGFFDGEGNIHITQPPHNLSMQVVNTNLESLRWLQERWGGSIYDKTESRPKNWSPCWAWHVHGVSEREVFLRAIQPFLIIKAPAVAIALEFLKTVDRPRGTAGIKERRHELFLELRGLPKPSYESSWVTANEQLGLPDLTEEVSLIAVKDEILA